ncbi:PREDICTED: microtubule-associated protein Jupiter isoform X1 [Dufourea novaeangliae]|uniref:microtubule-associated protein Jupiter isoform X1 n=1 Tax=Dufourea novaeangliae TaxID=178035 RepID=UPI000766FF40|nr:PREDICTED: microtubule-associated protein Jupiter isoform X1 [Dufourea novaeangliae]
MATYATYRHVELDNVGYGKKRVLKPPGGGSSDIFGAGPEETSPRRVKNHNQSQLGSALFGDGPNSNETPRNKPGNDSYKRLFGPPDAPPTTPNAKNHMRSNISLSGDSSSSAASSVASSGAATSPAKSTGSSDSIAGVFNGYAASNGNNLTNDITAFRRIKRFRGSSCITRNPVTGDGVDVTPIRRSARRCRDGNPVTGTGYADSQNNGPTMQNGTSSSSSSIGEKSNDSSPAAKAPAAARSRVPPGGYSSGLW